MHSLTATLCAAFLQPFSALAHTGDGMLHFHVEDGTLLLVLVLVLAILIAGRSAR
ncbi:MAG: hypothetical protein Q8O52_04875 [Sulfuritalea sp.]|nr:hypothetical protein [Sulfuritalea sp.]